MTLKNGCFVTKRDYAELYEDYKELYKNEGLDEPILLKWAIAAEFCNDLSLKQGLQPCYYLNGEVVDGLKDNYDIRGVNYECRLKNNGWRLPLRKEIQFISRNLYAKVGNTWLWTNDEGEWAESRIMIHAENGYTAKELEDLFGWKIETTRTGILAYSTDAITHDPEVRNAFVLIRTMYKDDFEKKPKTVV